MKACPIHKVTIHNGEPLMLISTPFVSFLIHFQENRGLELNAMITHFGKACTL